MKKLVVLLLVAVMCLSLVACGGDDTPKPNLNAENENTYHIEVTGEQQNDLDILGEWIAADSQNKILVFNEDGTCVTVNNDIVKYIQLLS